jgi:adenylate cyclase
MKAFNFPRDMGLILSSERVDRRLAAVLAADVAGYSRLMGLNEEGTLANLKSFRKTLVDPSIAAHRGRIVKTTGDGMLVEFASAVDAARCAVEVQRGMAAQNADVPQDVRIEFRIGIHVGDIIFDDNDIFGDGVNIAARLEGIAEPGGICISDDAQRQVRGKVDFAFGDLGLQTLKNIAEPMRAWRMQVDANASAAASTKSPAETAQPFAITDKPSIAVLPFTCFSEEREFKFLTEAMTEDLITMLARIPGFIVIARQSSFAYQGRSVDSRQIGRELGVRYIIEGSLRPVGQQLRVGTQLIDATTGAQLWADRFDGQAEDVPACSFFVVGHAAWPRRRRRSGRDGSAHGSRTRGDDRPRCFRGPGLCRLCLGGAWRCAKRHRDTGTSGRERSEQCTGMGRAGDFALLSREDGCYGTGEAAARDAAQPP